MLFMVTGTPCCLVGYKDNLWSKSISYLDKIFRQNHILADNEDEHTFQNVYMITIQSFPSCITTACILIKIIPKTNYLTRLNYLYSWMSLVIHSFKITYLSFISFSHHQQDCKIEVILPVASKTECVVLFCRLSCVSSLYWMAVN